MATTALKVEPGISSASVKTIPKEWDAAWFRRFIANFLMGGDVRNAIAGSGITITGNLASPFATISAAGGGGGALTKITEQVLVAPAASVSLASIPGTYRSLELTIYGQGTNASSQAIQAQFNGDTGTNYDSVLLYTSSPSASTVVTSTSINNPQIGQISSNASNSVGTVAVDIIGYTGSLYKTAQIRGITDFLSPEGTYTGGFRWRSTAAITSIQLFLAAGNFAAGTIVSLYGRS